MGIIVQEAAGPLELIWSRAGLLISLGARLTYSAADLRLQPATNQHGHVARVINMVCSDEGA